MTHWYRERSLVLGSAALTVACIAVVWTTSRALASPERGTPSRAGADVATPTIDESVTPSATLISRTLDRDPFHPERRRPTVPFRLPAEEAAAHAAPTAPPPASALRLLGTVVTPGQDAFAMGQLGTEPPRVVRVGGNIGGFTLRKIEPGRAVFTAPNGETMDLRVPKAGP
jgi:hypothetical protein